VTCNISLESPHYHSHTGQEMESIRHVVPKLLHIKRHLNFFLVYNLLGYDDDKYYALSCKKTVRIGPVTAKKHVFYC
jgi:hypothetical protein